MDQRQRRMEMIGFLLKDAGLENRIQIPVEEQEQKDLLRALMNIRLPRELPKEFLALQDAYFQEELKKRGVVEISSLQPIEKQLYVWKGDITRLAAGAIVNAANDQMLGCFVPNHRCIDNAIHTFAGMQLRLEMEEIMEKQGHPEETGQAKITAAWNLPCRYIIHTVGPIVYGKITEKEEKQLADCYWNCLKLVEAHQVESIAFCCISTGEFHFPNEKAAEIAIRTVRDFLKKTGSEMKVIINVFKQEDEDIYRKLLAAN